MLDKRKSEPSPVKRRFATLQKSRLECELFAGMIAAAHPTSPRAREAEKQLKEARKFVDRHELDADKSAADAVSERDSALANAALRQATEEISSTLKRVQQQGDDHLRLSARLDAAQGEFDGLKKAAEALLAARQSDFDAAMNAGDDAAQKTAAEAVASARRALNELGDAASHPTRLRIAALQSQVASAADAESQLAAEREAAEGNRKKAEVTLAQIASDVAFNVALEAFARAIALSTLSNRTRPQTIEDMYFWSPERCYAKRFIGSFGRSGFVTEHGIRRLGELAIEPDLRVFDQDPMQLRATEFTDEQAAEVAADKRERDMERAQREWDASVPIHHMERIAFLKTNPRPTSA